MSALAPWSVVESRVWQRDDGRTASIYGACPWTTEAERSRWTCIPQGWTLADARNGTVGYGRPALKTREEAEKVCAEFNARVAELRADWERRYGAKAGAT